MKLTRGRIASLLKQKKQTLKKGCLGGRILPKMNHLGTLKNKKRITLLHNKTLHRVF
jgi:hypothetical protein